jgi:hypothetical protein
MFNVSMSAAGIGFGALDDLCKDLEDLVWLLNERLGLRFLWSAGQTRSVEH